MSSESYNNYYSVAVAHVAPVYMDCRETTDKVKSYLHEIAERGADLVVFPESLIPGFPYWINLVPSIRQAEVHQNFVSESVTRDGPVIRELSDTTESLDIYAVIGVTLNEGNTLYNAQVFLGPDGLIAIRKKIVPTFAERTVWGRGDGRDLITYETQIGTLGGLICWEHMMNSARQALISQGEEFHLASWPGLRSLQGFGHADSICRTLMKAHSLTGQTFVLTAMSPCPPNVMDWLESHFGKGVTELQSSGGGWSGIIDPQSKVINEYDGVKDKILYSQIDKSKIRSATLFCDSDGHYSRPDILSLELDKSPQRNLQIKDETESFDENSGT